MNDQPLYSLTDMTGREASGTRQQTLGPVDMPYRAFVVGCIAFLIGIAPTLLLWIVVGPGALLLLVGFVVAAVWMFHGVTRRGLQIRNYQMLVNRRTAVLNQFMLGPATVKVPHDDWALIRPGGRPNPKKKVLPADQPLKPMSTAARVASIFD